MPDPNQTARRLLSALSSTDFGQALLEAIVVAPSTGAERTETQGVRDLEMNVYKSGSTIVLQIFDADAGAWREVTLS